MLLIRYCYLPLPLSLSLSLFTYILCNRNCFINLCLVKYKHRNNVDSAMVEILITIRDLSTPPATHVMIQLRNRSPLWSFIYIYIYFFADHRATVFTLSTTFETAHKKSYAAFLPIFVMKSGARTIKHIYFVSLDIYLHSSILIYLLIFISSSLS